MATIRKTGAASLINGLTAIGDGFDAAGSVFRIAGKAASALEYSVDNWAEARKADSDKNALVADEVRDFETMAEIAERTEEAAKRCVSIPADEQERIRKLIAARKEARS